jgi:hypothetical protein
MVTCVGVYSTRKFLTFEAQMPFPAFRASKFALKFVLTILVFEIRKGKTQKVKKEY